MIRAERGVLITETSHGLVCANAGIDARTCPATRPSRCCPRTPTPRRAGSAPRSPTRAASRPAVIVSDSFGRAWRLGQAEVAIGCAGVAPLDDWRGPADRERQRARRDADRGRRRGRRGRRPGPRQGRRRSRRRSSAASGAIVTDDDGPGAAALQRPARRGPLPLAARPVSASCLPASGPPAPLLRPLGRARRPCPASPPSARIRTPSSPVMSLRLLAGADAGEDAGLELVAPRRRPLSVALPLEHRVDLLLLVVRVVVLGVHARSSAAARSPASRTRSRRARRAPAASRRRTRLRSPRAA